VNKSVNRCWRWNLNIGNRETGNMYCMYSVQRTMDSTCKWDRIVRTVVQYVLWCHNSLPCASLVSGPMWSRWRTSNGFTGKLIIGKLSEFIRGCPIISDNFIGSDKFIGWLFSVYRNLSELKLLFSITVYFLELLAPKNKATKQQKAI
jgi:hypothetical protein